MDTLRQEILQAQSVRSDLLKWKLGLVGGLGAAGLGFAGSNRLGHADLVLCAIPPVCVYVDLLCRHLSLRILVIGSFLRSRGDGDPSLKRLADYEERVDEARQRGAFDLEEWALAWSSYALSLAVAVYGVIGAYDGSLPLRFAVPFVVSGGVALLVTFGGQQLFRRRLRILSPARGPDA
jgi:hypothetical protein